MSSEVEEAAALPAEPAWYSKIFECVKSRNRIGPGKVELPECDFFIVGPRRTLRVLLPTPKGAGYYEPSSTERPETIDENFVSRWAMRPHPSGNCRCSFRQSKNRLSTSEDRMISAELNRIRTSLSEAERSGEDMEIVERRISLKLDGLSAADGGAVIVGDHRSQVDEKLAEIANVGPPLASKREDDVAIKNKIVKDLERYIEVLLQEVLSDTMKFFSDAGETLRRSRAALSNGKECGSVCSDPEHLDSCGSREEVEESRIRREEIDEEADGRTFDEEARKSFEISFAFHGQVARAPGEEAHARRDEARYQNGGYVNRAFSGSNNDPDSLDFDLRKPVGSDVTLENLDCIDSGINSVETIEFQTSEEPSLEQSLMEIIDAKFGPSKGGWKDSGKIEGGDDKKDVAPSTQDLEIRDVRRETEKDAKMCNGKENLLVGKMDEERRFEVEEPMETLKNDSALRRLEETPEELNDISDQPTFDKLRLELMGTGSEEKRTSAVTSLREKFARKFGCGKREMGDEEKLAEKTKDEETPPSPVELRVKSEKIWHEIRQPADAGSEQNQTDFVKVRRSKKPTIVFLHGFGSSAEIFEHQLEYFSNLGYPCVAPEMLGHGMSSAPDRPRDYHFDKLLRDLDMILQHYAFGAGRKCVLVAHNYGCSFATALACKYDSNIHQLVLISGGGPTPLAPPSTEGAGHCCLRAMLTPLLMCGLHRDILYSARGRQHPYCGSEPPEQWPSHMKYVLDGMVWPEGDYVFHRRISTPTLLIHGLRDNKVSLVQECQMERTIIKGFLDAIPTAGHTPMTDCPEQVNHMIHCFIDLWKRKKR